MMSCIHTLSPAQTEPMTDTEWLAATLNILDATT
jgi:hypothetical protein